MQTEIKQRVGDIVLPSAPQSNPADTSPLLWLLFDLVRHGLAHQYQQMILDLPDTPVYITLGGPQHKHTIEAMKAAGPGNHLAGEDVARGGCRHRRHAGVAVPGFEGLR